MEQEEIKWPAWFILVPLGILELYTLLLFCLADNWRNGFMFIVSTAFGFFLKYGDVGFARSFKAMVESLNFYNMRLLFILFISGNIFCNIFKAFDLCPIFSEECKTYSYSPSESPIGTSLIIGSFIFGIGMILAMCCASGTFMRLGTGNVKTLVVLLFAIIGSTFAVADPIYDSYTGQPKTDKPVTIHFTLICLILLVLYFGSLGIDYIKQKKFNKEVNDPDYVFFAGLFGVTVQTNSEESTSKWKKNSLFAFLLGFTCALYYFCFGSMIGISGCFQVIGANFLRIFGAKPGNWNAFGKDPELNPFNVNIWNNDVYIFIGSFLASVIQGVFGKVQENSVYHYIRASIGGFLMGVGARMSYGCNIGSMTSGITANSLHGFIWMIFCSLGSWVAVTILKYVDAFIEEQKNKKKCDLEEPVAAIEE